MDLKAKFQKTFDQYQYETAICSTSHQMRRAETYPQLVEMGEPIVPFLLEEVGGENYGINTQILLHAITGADPSASNREPLADGLMVGIDVAGSAQSWRTWGRSAGYDFK